MSRTGTSESVRRQLDAAESLGGQYEGIDGRGHHVINFAGTRYRIASTPSERRGERNAIADMERIAGRKLGRPNAASYPPPLTGIRVHAPTHQAVEAVG